jgi:hypothetical protein
MIDYFKQKFQCNKFEIKGDILQYPDCHEEEIYMGSYCKHNPEECYERIRKTPFGKTKVPIKMYKKTVIKKDDILIDVLTEVIVPSQTEIHFENCNGFIYGKNRVAQGIVGKQAEIESGEETDNSMSIYQYRKCQDIFNPCLGGNFIYTTGQLIRPYEFYNYYDWIKNNKLDATCKSGIHLFYDEYQAKDFEF